MDTVKRLKSKKKERINKVFKALGSLSSLVFVVITLFNIGSIVSTLLIYKNADNVQVYYNLLIKREGYFIIGLIVNIISLVCICLSIVKLEIDRSSLLNRFSSFFPCVSLLFFFNNLNYSSKQYLNIFLLFIGVIFLILYEHEYIANKLENEEVKHHKLIDFIFSFVLVFIVVFGVYKDINYYVEAYKNNPIQGYDSSFAQYPFEFISNGIIIFLSVLCLLKSILSFVNKDKDVNNNYLYAVGIYGVAVLCSYSFDPCIKGKEVIKGYLLSNEFIKNYEGSLTTFLDSYKIGFISNNLTWLFIFFVVIILLSIGINIVSHVLLNKE